MLRDRARGHPAADTPLAGDVALARSPVDHTYVSHSGRGTSLPRTTSK